MILCRFPQRVFGSASSPAGSVSAPHCSARGSAGTGCSSRCARLVAFGCTRPRTPSASGGCSEGLDPGTLGGRGSARCASERPSLRRPARERSLNACWRRSAPTTRPPLHEVLEGRSRRLEPGSRAARAHPSALMQVGREWERGDARGPAGALREQHDAGAAAVPGRLVGSRRGTGGGAGVRAGRAAASPCWHSGWSCDRTAGASSPGRRHADRDAGASRREHGSALTVLASLTGAPGGEKSTGHPPSGQRAPARVERPRGNRAALQEAPRAAAQAAT